MAGALETVIAPFYNTTKVCAHSRYGTDPLMIPIYKKLTISQVGKCINWEIVFAADLKSLLVPGEAGHKLAQQAEGGKDTCKGSRPNGKTFDKISPGVSGCILILHGFQGFRW